MKSITLLSFCLWVASLGPVRAQNPIANDSTNASATETAVLGGGCFWCLEAQYQLLPGVKSVVSGYAGGTKADPTYEEVCTGLTGHAEAIQIEFDPKVLSYEKILEAFWHAHDPTTFNSQGPDHGTQYRSIILYNSPAQKAAAIKSKAEAQKQLTAVIQTQIVPLKRFYPAEDYHQNFFRTNPNHPYCRAIIQPKVEKFEKSLGHSPP